MFGWVLFAGCVFQQRHSVHTRMPVLWLSGWLTSHTDFIGFVKWWSFHLKHLKLNDCSALQHVFLMYYLKSGCENILYTVTNATITQCFNPSACCFLFLGVFFSFSFSLNFSQKRSIKIYYLASKCILKQLVSEDSTVIVALVVLISSASAGFSGCQKWNKWQGCSNSVRSGSTVMCCEHLGIFLLELDSLLSMSAACVPVVFFLLRMNY